MRRSRPGWRTFPDFRERVLTRFQTRMYAFLNIASMGMVSTTLEQNVADMDGERTAAVMKEHSDLVVGSKTAHFLSPDWVSTDRALAAGQATDMPAMIDFGLFLASPIHHESRLDAKDLQIHSVE